MEVVKLPAARDMVSVQRRMGEGRDERVSK